MSFTRTVWACSSTQLTLIGMLVVAVSVHTNLIRVHSTFILRNLFDERTNFSFLPHLNCIWKWRGGGVCCYCQPTCTVQSLRTSNGELQSQKVSTYLQIWMNFAYQSYSMWKCNFLKVTPFIMKYLLLGKFRSHLLTQRCQQVQNTEES